MPPAADYLNIPPDVIPGDDARYDEEDGQSEQPEQEDNDAVDLFYSDAEEEVPRANADAPAPGSWSPSGAGSVVAVIDAAIASVHSLYKKTVDPAILTHMASMVQRLSSKKPKKPPALRASSKLPGWGRVIYVADSSSDDFGALTSEGFDTLKHAAHIS